MPIIQRDEWGKLFHSETQLVQLMQNNNVTTFQLHRLVILYADNVLGAEAAVARVIDAGQKDGIYGLDFEWKPTERDARIALIQISSGRMVALLHIAKFNYQLPNGLKQLLFGRSAVMYLTGGPEDKKRFLLTFGFGLPSNVLSMHELAKACGYVEVGQRKMAKLLLHESFEKSDEWNVDWTGPLRYCDIKYAALDAIVVEHIVRTLKDSPQSRSGGTEVLGASSWFNNTQYGTRVDEQQLQEEKPTIGWAGLMLGAAAIAGGAMLYNSMTRRPGQD